MTRLSNRQYPMLQTFASGGSDYMSIDEAQKFDQRPFRSMLIREWVKYRPGHGFYLTREGRDAWHSFHTTEILRRNPLMPLTSYFVDPAGTQERKKKRKARVHVMPASA